MNLRKIFLNRIGYLVLIVTTGLLNQSCGGDDDNGLFCTPNVRKPCDCPGGGQGWSTCSSDGTAWGPCLECGDECSNEYCGNGYCNANCGETEYNCPEDCSQTDPCDDETCGNGSCNADCGEDCLTCPSDCGSCEPECGDGVCEGSEDDFINKPPEYCPEDCFEACSSSQKNEWRCISTTTAEVCDGEYWIYLTQSMMKDACLDAGGTQTTEAYCIEFSDGSEGPVCCGECDGYEIECGPVDAGVCSWNCGTCGSGLECNDNGQCVSSEIPSEWTCNTSYYDADDGCDCGCGVLDPDCADSTAASCEYCNEEGSCDQSGQGCPGDIHPTQNWLCSDGPTCGDGACDSGEDYCNCPQDCAQSTCSGCCSGSSCVAGTSDSSCGSGGVSCETCTGNDECIDQSCQYVAGCGNGVCDSGENYCNCPQDCAQSTCSGCCSGILCLSGTSNSACGSGGVSCVSCGSNETCTNGSCETQAECQPGETQSCSTPCGTGEQDCVGGEWGECVYENTWNIGAVQDAGLLEDSPDSTYYDDELWNLGTFNSYYMDFVMDYKTSWWDTGFPSDAQITIQSASMKIWFMDSEPSFEIIVTALQKPFDSTVTFNKVWEVSPTPILINQQWLTLSWDSSQGAYITYIDVSDWFQNVVDGVWDNYGIAIGKESRDPSHEYNTLYTLENTYGVANPQIRVTYTCTN